MKGRSSDQKWKHALSLIAIRNVTPKKNVNIFLLKFKGEGIIVYFIILHVFWHSYLFVGTPQKMNPQQQLDTPVFSPNFTPSIPGQRHTLRTNPLIGRQFLWNHFHSKITGHHRWPQRSVPETIFLFFRRSWNVVFGDRGRFRIHTDEIRVGTATDAPWVAQLVLQLAVPSQGTVRPGFHHAVHVLIHRRPRRSVSNFLVRNDVRRCFRMQRRVHVQRFVGRQGGAQPFGLGLGRLLPGVKGLACSALTVFIVVLLHQRSPSRVGGTIVPGQNFHNCVGVGGYRPVQVGLKRAVFVDLLCFLGLHFQNLSVPLFLPSTQTIGSVSA
jgi:hypothetical protein